MVIHNLNRVVTKDYITSGNKAGQNYEFVTAGRYCPEGVLILKGLSVIVNSKLHFFSKPPFFFFFFAYSERTSL